MIFRFYFLFCFLCEYSVARGHVHSGQEIKSTALCIMYLGPVYMEVGDPSTIDGCGKVPEEAVKGSHAILEGNHDNPESGTHKAPSH